MPMNCAWKLAWTARSGRVAIGRTLRQAKALRGTRMSRGNLAQNAFSLAWVDYHDNEPGSQKPEGDLAARAGSA